MPPRTAYSPVSRTVPVRRKPLASTQATTLSIETTLPIATEKVSTAMRVIGGTRWIRALTVVQRMRGRSSAERVRARRAKAVIRAAAVAVVGETRS